MNQLPLIKECIFQDSEADYINRYMGAVRGLPAEPTTMVTDSNQPLNTTFVDSDQWLPLHLSHVSLMLNRIFQFTFNNIIIIS